MLRRFGAIFYDGLLLFAVLFAGTAALLPLTGGRAVAPGSGWYQAYLLALSFLYFGWFWTHGGQTLGMRAWRLRLRVRGHDEGRLPWRWALARFLTAGLSWAALGLGFAWALWDPERLTWHDRLSGTMLVLERSARRAA